MPGRMSHRTPGRGDLGALRITPADEHLELVGEESRRGRICLGRPPLEPALGQPLLAQPVALPIEGQQLHRRARSAPEHEYGAGEWIRRQRLPAHLGQPIDPAPEIDLSSDMKVDPRDDTNIDPLVDVNPMGCPERRP